MSLLLLKEELGFISGKMAYPEETGSYHALYTHMLRCVWDPGKVCLGDESNHWKPFWTTWESYSALAF
jgi:hypothetical protein